MVTNDEISQWLDNPQGAPTADRVSQLADEMPWFLLPQALAVRNRADGLEADEQAAMMSRLAVSAPDLYAMSMVADADFEAEFARFYPKSTAPTKPSTENAIDKFINTYGKPDPQEDALLEKLIFNPTPDYAQILAREEEESAPEPGEAPEGSPDDLINNFIIKSKAIGGQFPSATPEPEPEPAPAPSSTVSKPAETDSALPSEALAQIYIRRGNFSRAYEIINQLNLNFPEKSIYFADQLRFLAKLMRLTGQTNATGE